MLALSHKLVFLILLAGTALLSSVAGAAERRCDQRELSARDTSSVEAAARKAADGTLSDLAVSYVCTFDGRSSVTLRRDNPVSRDYFREFWIVSCERQRKLWLPGRWNCKAPELRRGMELEVPFAAAHRTAYVAFAGNIPFETAEGLTRRAFALFQEHTPQPYCTTVDGFYPRSDNPQAQWEAAQAHYPKFMADYARFTGDNALSTFIERQDQVFHLQPFAFDIGFAFEFPHSAAADPAHADGCWGEWLIID